MFHAIFGTSPPPTVINSFLCVLEPQSREGLTAGHQSSSLPPPFYPLAPPRFQLVAEPGGLRCAGLVEFYSGGLGGTIGIKPKDEIKDLGQLICAALQCGSFLKPLPATEAAWTPEPGDHRPLPIRWEIQSPRCTSLEQCFRKVQPRVHGQALGLICSGEWEPTETHGRPHVVTSLTSRS